MERFTFKEKRLKDAYEARLLDLQKLTEDLGDDEIYRWDETVRKHAATMKKVCRVLEEEEISEYVTSRIKKNMETLLKRCASAELHIALVGAIKAGKSTLINALLGYEYASTRVTPETAALTKFRKGKENYVKVQFYRNDEWDKLYKSAVDSKASVFLEEYKQLQGDSNKDQWLSRGEEKFVCDSREALVGEISRWTSSKSAVHYFVKEVEVGLTKFELPDGVVLVDTPGLDDVVEYRSNITRDYIDRANAVLVCVKSDALTGPEMATIYSVFANTRYNPEKVYIIATQLDTLNRPRENWDEQQKEWLKYLKGKGAYNSMELARKNLIPVSAYLYTLLQSYGDLNEEDDRYWDLDSILRKMRIRIEELDRRYNELKEFTNIGLLNNKLYSEVAVNHKEILIKDIENSYECCRDEIREAMGKIRKSQEEFIEAGLGGMDEIRKKQEEYTNKYQQAATDKKDLQALLKRLQNLMQKRADELEQRIMRLGVK